MDAIFLRQLHLQGRFQFGTHVVDGKIGYHCPCHLRLLEVGEPGFQLLKLIDGLNVEHLSNNCCGLAGTYGLAKGKYDMSMAIAKNLQESISTGQYDRLATECSSCRMQLRHLSHRPTLHPIQFLDQWYGK